MPYVSPTKYLKKKELLNSKRFYRLLSAQTNFIDPDTTMLFYVGMAMLITDELRKHNFVRLPILGDFCLVEQKPRVAWLGKLQAVIGTREVLKFYPNYHLRRYFNKRQGFPRYGEILPPKPIE
ncbi:MAG: hypothetical protein A3C50_03010 [Candidatus Staskawiczbacteria bacterium RIFCSPHIGHO2_02_FULL_43_16]|uniref:Uncharacterized protein n=1 Tax=Candidatus Staskawiczbacteria bacterium RIFCSPHIGHO2_01_FULL_41_41 TaxID=1802203 RepID=A0A1G2HRY9_9BACT|nr:MAG: hypothetical protein A2822_01085 [Candidatus Staskawiczbacteria bacterium RIFCSPHIGHO2_01_FULL_41_41]OGZ68585.1 MAG: hypothetical protein A3C50_03010 [Candidatus Staskawiczbacteria bacterium RIFCSPHIGHO2_02_FULL_43_16]